MTYNPPQFDQPISLPLGRNESQAAMDDLSSQLGNLASEYVSRYPNHIELQNLIGDSLAVDPGRIVITAGGDESIDRMMRLTLAGSRRKVVTHMPTFEMVEVYARMNDGEIDAVAWMKEDFPLDSLEDRIDSQTAMVVLVTPNNPTGRVISAESIWAVADATKRVGAKLLVDNAYIEFAENDPTHELVQHDNINIVRTFSKAWGLAGLRVGYLVAASAEEATAVRNLAGPFPVSAVSLEMARRSLAKYRPQMLANVERTKQLRSRLHRLLIECKAEPMESQGNFVLAKFEHADSVWRELAIDGIGVRKFNTSLELKNYLRITCPVLVGDYLRLAQSLCRIFVLDFDHEKDRLGQLLLDSSLTLNGSSLPVAPQPPEVEKPDGMVMEAAQPPVTASASATKLIRQTKETKIELELELYGSGKTEIGTGIGFLDHMLTALAFHSRMDLKLKCVGDLHIDDHHTSEDCAIALGSAIDKLLGPRSGIQRFGFAFAPLDEALARTVIDLSARPWPEIHLKLEREMIGNWACENMVHFFQSLTMNMRCSMHIDVLRGGNDHHRVEAAFKSLALALRQALMKTERAVPSTKGML